MNCIELFAGCGGLTLGLERSGFKLLFANELSPMAAETYAFNILGEDLSTGDASKVYWLSSKFSRTDIKSRLKENPLESEGMEGNVYSDLDDLDASDLNGSLLVGSIKDLNSIIARSDSMLASMKNAFGHGEVDLISGGPPCQSFSLAGLRQHSNERNRLPWEFVKFANQLTPKMVLLENVTGILRPFQIDGKKYYAWIEVCKAFSEIGYVPLCLHVNAKYVGAAQNRPRFVMLAFRKDIFESILSSSNDSYLNKALINSKIFFDKVCNGENITIDSFSYYDIEKNDSIYDSPIFSPLKKYRGAQLASVKDAIEDLAIPGQKPSKYVRHVNSAINSKNSFNTEDIRNHEVRTNSLKVRARFRLYQILNNVERSQSKEVIKFLQSEGESELRKSTLESIMKYWILDLKGQVLNNPTIDEVLSLLSNLYTKKQTQRALIADQPAPAALSIPDDACHYIESSEMQRTLTVREMARIQSFPDWFVFRSKVTTGGKMRRFQVPQYTQVGNAVPPLLGLALGEVCKDLLCLSQNGQNVYSHNNVMVMA